MINSSFTRKLQRDKPMTLQEQRSKSNGYLQKSINSTAKPFPPMFLSFLSMLESFPPMFLSFFSMSESFRPMFLSFFSMLESFRPMFLSFFSMSESFRPMFPSFFSMPEPFRSINEAQICYIGGAIPVRVNLCSSVVN